MIGLARFVTRGRMQALLVAVLAAGIPLLFWLSAAVVGLLTLRQGLAGGMLVLIWALLPAAAMAWLGELVPGATLVAVWLAAGLLRATVSWQLVLLAAAGFGFLFSALLATVGGAYLELIRTMFEEFFAGLGPEAREAATVPDIVDISGMFGVILVVTTVLSLLLARGWQAALDNPGGLRRELHALRLEAAPATGLLLVALLLAFLLEGYALWAWIALLPLLFAGIGLIHGLVAQRGLGTSWLVLMYLGLALLPPVKQGLIVLAVADGWLNFRARLGASR